ncbi:MAG: DUF4159 domain-containing protein, partial [bacterium]|nr:DUF4159 domain-containing protein [bacterium]
MKTLLIASLLTSLLTSLLVPAVLTAQGHSDRASTFFVGRLQFSENSGRECGDVGLDLVNLVSRASTIHVREEKTILLSDDDLFETPFLFMNGHGDFQLSDSELDN